MKLFFALLLFGNVSSEAACLDKLENLKYNSVVPVVTTLVGSFGAGMIGSTGSSTVGAITAGAVATGSVGFTLVHNHRIQRVINLIQDSYSFLSNQNWFGPQLAEMYQKAKTTSPDLTVENLAKTIVAGNESESICSNGKFRSFRQIRNSL